MVRTERDGLENGELLADISHVSTVKSDQQRAPCSEVRSRFCKSAGVLAESLGRVVPFSGSCWTTHMVLGHRDATAMVLLRLRPTGRQPGGGQRRLRNLRSTVIHRSSVCHCGDEDDPGSGFDWHRRASGNAAHSSRICSEKVWCNKVGLQRVKAPLTCERLGGA